MTDEISCKSETTWVHNFHTTGDVDETLTRVKALAAVDNRNTAGFGVGAEFRPLGTVLTSHASD